METQPINSQPTALVLGATGGIGGAVAQTLLNRGWTVRALHRDPVTAATQTAGRLHGVEWRIGDAMDGETVTAAAVEVNVIVHAVNPPGYRHWERLVLPMIDNTLLAAKSSGARVLLPGTVYNYGVPTSGLLHEDTPQQPQTRKGAIRVTLEARLRRAADAGVRSLVVRAGDFFGPHVGNSWFSQGMVRPGHAIKAVTLPGRKGVGHQWAYLPDVAETMVRLLERPEALADFDTFHTAGHWDADGLQMLASIRRTTGQSNLQSKSFPWWLLPVAAPFVPLFKELREMRPLWQNPVQMSNQKLLRVLGEEPHTPLDDAVAQTLRALGCLPLGKMQSSPSERMPLSSG